MTRLIRTAAVALTLATVVEATAAEDERIVVYVSGGATSCALARVDRGTILPATLDDIVRLGFRAWTLQLDPRRRIAIEGTTPLLSEDDCDGDPVVELGLGAGREGLAYGGAVPAETRLDSDRQGPWPSDYAALRAVLRDEFALPSGIPLAIADMVVADVDGDGIGERLLLAQWEGITSADRLATRTTSYDLLVLLDPDQPPRILGGAVDGPARTGEWPVWGSLVALVDLDGDGLPEIVHDEGRRLRLLSRQAPGDYLESAACEFALSSCD